LAELFAVTE
jgi:hypothetical protein